MTEVKPATDADIEVIAQEQYSCPDCGCQNADKCEQDLPKLLARIEQDRAALASVTRERDEALKQMEWQPISTRIHICLSFAPELRNPRWTFDKASDR